MSKQELKIDWLTVILYVAFVVLGWFSILAATYKDNSFETIFAFDQDYGKQIIWIGVAAAVALITILIDTRVLEFASYGAYGLSIVMLIMVLIFGRVVNGAKSWFGVGGFGIQPAEFAKVATAMAVAAFMSRFNFSLKSPIFRLILASIIGLPVLLIMLQRDTGTAMVFVSFLVMLYREGLNPLYLIVMFLVLFFSVFVLVVNNEALTIIIIAVCATLSYYFVFQARYRALHITLGVLLSVVVVSLDFIVNNVLQPHQRDRVYALFNPELDPLGTNWNTTQSKIAIGSGGFTGKGFLNGTQTKYNFVPQQATDFIFCTVGEEYGWVGSSILLALFFVFLYQLLYMAENSKSTYARIFGYCIAGIFFFHIAVNIAMTIGLSPVIGIPLPFFSYGGSSLIAFTLMVFIALNFYSNRVNVYSQGR